MGRVHVLLLLVVLGLVASCGGDDPTCVVTFNSLGGSSVAPLTVSTGGLLAMPNPAPTNGAFAFGGWYRDAACLTPWMFATDRVSADMTLYAKWWVAVPGPVLLPEMVSVPAGANISIGWAGLSEPVHTVASLSAFRIGKYEVTYALWTNVVVWALANGYTFTAGSGVMGDGSGDTELHPVTTINHRDALAWCNALSQRSGLGPVYFTTAGQTNVYTNATDTTSALVATGTAGANDCVRTSANGYRLPTEAQWEYASRRRADGTLTDGDKPAGYNGTFTNYADAATALAEWGPYGWFTGNSSGTHIVGTTTYANGTGLYDMSGNVWEFCWDWNASYTTASPFTDTDTLGAPSGTGRVLRGGSWDDGASWQRIAARYSSPPTVRSDYIGFRVVAAP